MDRVTLKVALGNSPYFLVYGKEYILHPNFCLPSLQLSQLARGTPSKMNQYLSEIRGGEGEYSTKVSNHQLLVKRWFDKNYVGNKDLKVGDLVLK